jgi:hypothetical protein
MSQPVIINGRLVSYPTIALHGVDHRDYPDYADAYVIGAQFVDGDDLTEQECELIQELYPEVVMEVATESMTDMADYYNDLMFDR